MTQIKTKIRRDESHPHFYRDFTFRECTDFFVSIKIPELGSLKEFTFHKNVLNLLPPFYFETIK